MLNEQSHQRLRSLSVPIVAQALDELGLVLEFAPGFNPLGAGTPIVGTAITMRVTNTDQERQGGYAHLAAALEAAHSVYAPVLIIQSPDVNGATWDIVNATAAHQRGVPCAIVDGAVRDVHDMQSLGFSVFAPRVTPWPAARRVDSVSFNQPVHIGGEEVTFRDIIMADIHGIIVVPEQSVNEVLKRAELIREQRNRILDAIRAGTPYGDVTRSLKQGP